jgi:hypothetical protein
MTRFLTYFAALCAGLGVLSIAFIVTVIFFPAILPDWMPAVDSSQLEELSSYVKGVPVVFFTAATVSFVFLTYIKQREDADRNQVAVTRQVFDSTFFTMLSTLHELRGDVQAQIAKGEQDESRQTVSGTAFFKAFHDQLSGSFYARDADGTLRYVSAIETEQRLQSLDGEIQRIDIGTLRRGLADAFAATLDRFDTQMGNYLRFLSSVLVFIGNGPVSERDRYANMVQNQLSGYELMILFYAGLAEYRPKGADPKTLYNLIQKYGLVDTIEPIHLLNTVHAYLYPKVAFRFLKQAQIKLRDDLSQAGILGLTTTV